MPTLACEDKRYQDEEAAKLDTHPISSFKQLRIHKIDNKKSKR